MTSNSTTTSTSSCSCEVVAIVDEKFCFQEETTLTVHKASVFFHGDGLIVYDSEGEVLFRFDSYGPDSKDDHLVLMDASGNGLLTLVRKKPSLHQRCEGYLGEITKEETNYNQTQKKNQDPIFTIRKSSIIGPSIVVVEVHRTKTIGETMVYQMEGPYTHRCCTICNSWSKEIVAETKRKVDTGTNVLLNKDVFLLCLKRGFDCAFAAGLVLVLDQTYERDGALVVDPATDYSTS